ncbi:MAG: hypothetical protein GTO02_04690 [Candidatus Dadabacteria bacterium]|nr:hypothetical protein [Candidatus Dadabacteria bacterium]NIQ13711.1 hypothetical protein [Candidatus Dadabacteria bacterium]
MKLVGPAGNLEIKVVDLAARNDFLVLSTQMGVWQQNVTIDYEDIRILRKLIFKLSVISFLLKFFIRSAFYKKKKD